MVVPGTIFEEFGFNYVGPIDGHDLDSLIPTLENLRAKRGPQFLHVVTKKGYGYKLAEADPVKYHGPASSTRPRASQAGHPPSPPSRRSSASGCATWPSRRAPGRHHAGDARGLGHGRVPQALSASATSTWASPSSTP
jgi:1-deoxy-D-xylulose-5-phosphate synthase